MKNLTEKFLVIDLKACTNLNEERMNQQAEKYGLKAMTYQEILDDPQIDMIINLTTPKAHYVITTVSRTVRCRVSCRGT